jgi:hypothetical protein
MTRPTENIRLDPPVVRDHANRLSAQGADLENAVWSLNSISGRDPIHTEVDELAHAFLRHFDPRAQQSDARGRAVASEFVGLGATAAEVVDVYERVDAEAATKLSRERGLLPPR